ncbi:unnamed protein product [Candidula unifasciata]|uniref:Uncharacterized protein n=1 Tax=Candidula unifasciata TaxID=100452 RepID=A0A8S3ZUV4_9EUPU|nr:unnamed protein product [Candidula unifasciata]
MTIVHKSVRVLCRLFPRHKYGKNYTHLSQPLYRVNQQGVSQEQRKSGGWVIPATLVILGLGFSMFSTHQLVSGSDSVKMLSSFSGKK